MSSVKTTAKHGVLVALETTSYGSGTPTNSPTTDGVIINELPVVSAKYQNDGSRQGKVTNGISGLKRVNPSGRGVHIPLTHHFRGPGAANPYAAGLKANCDALLQANGWAAAFSATPTPQWTYTPLSSSWASLVASIYAKGQLEVLKGGYVQDFEFAAKGPAMPTMKFNVAGISTGTPTDAAVPAITYRDAAIMPPKATNVLLTLTSGGQTFTGKVADFTFKASRTIVERENQNDATGAHGGFALGPLTCSLDFTVESANLEVPAPYINTSTLDPYKLFDIGSVFQASLQVGSVQYNRIKISSGNAQFSTEPKDVSNGPVAQWQASLVFSPADDASEIDCTILLN